MSIELLSVMTAAVLVVALLYSSVGHAGASGYIAVMSLFSLAPTEIRPSALLLNILVASITSWQFWRAGHFRWALFWPFALPAVPMAFVGGYISLPTHVFQNAVGVILWVSALQLIVRPAQEGEPRAPSKAVALGTGAGLGLLAGLTGTGGGIFLTPLLIFTRWAKTASASAVSAPFILLNSIAALSGNVAATKYLPSFALPLLVAAVIGGTIGSHFGSRRLSPWVVKRLLGLVLAIAGAKLLLT